MNKKIIGGVSFGIVLFLSLYFYFKWKHFKNEMNALKIPPWISECPDYWTMEKKGVCRNTHNLGKCAHDSTIDFNDSRFKGKDGGMNKCRFSHNCNLSWTGIDKLCR